MAKGILNRIVLMVLLAAVLLPGSLRAQRIGQVEYGSRIFSTGLPRYPIPWAEDFTPPMMTKERRQTALECIEWTFGTIVKYEEEYGGCCGFHHLVVTLDNGDTLNFEEGLLFGYDLETSRFVVAKDWFEGGLRVGQKPGRPLNGNIKVVPRKNDPTLFDFWDERKRSDVVSAFRVRQDGTIISIHVGFFEC